MPQIASFNLNLRFEWCIFGRHNALTLIDIWFKNIPNDLCEVYKPFPKSHYCSNHMSRALLMWHSWFLFVIVNVENLLCFTIWIIFITFHCSLPNECVKNISIIIIIQFNHYFIMITNSWATIITLQHFNTIITLMKWKWYYNNSDHLPPNPYNHIVI